MNGSLKCPDGRIWIESPCLRAFVLWRSVCEGYNAWVLTKIRLVPMKTRRVLVKTDKPENLGEVYDVQKIFLLLLVLVCCVGVYGQKSKKTPPQKITPTISAPHMNSQHREIVQNWLAGKPGWRPAIEDDASVGETKEGREILKGEIQSA